MRLRARVLLLLVATAAPVSAAALWLRVDVNRRAAASSLADLARTRMESGGRELCESAPASFQEPPLFRGPGDPPPFDPLGLGRPRPRGPGGPPGRRDVDRPPEAGSLGDPERDGPEGIDPLDGSEAEGRAPLPNDSEGGPRRGPEGPGLGPLGPGPRIELFAYAPDFHSANPRAPLFPVALKSELESGSREASEVRLAGESRTTTVALRMSWSEGPCAIVLARRREPRPPWNWMHDAGSLAVLILGLVGAMLLAVGPLVRRVRHLGESVRRSSATRYREPVPVVGSDEIADLARAFNAAGAEVRVQIEEIEKREQTLRRFVENTTHDVMLPLTVLQGHLTRIRNDIAKGEIPGRETVREALEESHYLTSLVHNMGAAAKLDSGEPELQRNPVSWNTIVERVVLRHQSIAREKGVGLDFAVPEADVRVLGDLTLVEQALSNVVHNGVRYNRAGGHVAILLEAPGERFRVRVFDDGPGVSEAELARIAERSYRGDEARTRHPGGMGLGLAIARDVALRHGFSFEVRKSEAGGLEVEIAGERLRDEAPEGT